MNPQRKARLVHRATTLFARLPWPLLRGVAHALAWTWVRVNARESRVTRRNLELAYPELDGPARDRLHRELLRSTALQAIETLRLWSRQPADNLRLHLKQRHGEALYDAALASGKGVIVAMSLTEAEDAVRDMLSGNAFGDAGARVVIEEFLDGEEASFISMVDGVHALPMATSQDHKRVGDGDTGPNTGGMGAYSPAPVVTPEVHARVMREVVNPTVQGMIADGIPFTGFLYAGLMIDASGAPKVIEFNVRFGDPETQPVMLRLQSDLVELVEAAIDGRLDEVEAQWDARPSLGVVLAARPYPEAPITGDVISGLDDVPASAKVFHAGTALDAQGHVVSAGGRVLCVAALGDSVRDAQANAYAGVAKVSWANAFHRNDIGWRAIAREE